MSKSRKSSRNSNEKTFLKKLTDEISDNLVKYIASLIILVISGTLAAFWDKFDFPFQDKGMIELQVKNSKKMGEFQLKIYQEDHFIQRAFTGKTYKLNPGNYELKIKVDWAAKPILYEKFKILNKQKTLLEIEIPEPQLAKVTGDVKLRGTSLEPGVNFVIEAIQQDKRTKTNDEGSYFLELEPSPFIKLAVKKNSKIIWDTAIIEVKPGDLVKKNIIIPYERLY